jgi:hypothetical protein
MSFLQSSKYVACIGLDGHIHTVETERTVIQGELTVGNQSLQFYILHTAVSHHRLGGRMAIPISWVVLIGFVLLVMVPLASTCSNHRLNKSHRHSCASGGRIPLWSHLMPLWPYSRQCPAFGPAISKLYFKSPLMLLICLFVIC